MSRHIKRGRGTLHVIAGLLMVSGLLRLAVPGQAIAESAKMPEPLDVIATDEPPVTANAALLAALQARETRVAAREDQLQKRMAALDTAEGEAARQLSALITAEESLRATIALADVAAENDIEKLVAVYENMKPKDAAALFEQMTPDFAAGFLAMMTPQSAAQVLAQVPPDAAYAVSVVLAGRNAGVPTQ